MQIKWKLNAPPNLTLATFWIPLLGCFELVLSQSRAFLGLSRAVQGLSMFVQGLSWVVLGLVWNVLKVLGLSRACLWLSWSFGPVYWAILGLPWSVQVACLGLSWVCLGLHWGCLGLSWTCIGLKGLGTAFYPSSVRSFQNSPASLQDGSRASPRWLQAGTALFQDDSRMAPF